MPSPARVNHTLVLAGAGRTSGARARSTPRQPRTCQTMASQDPSGPLHHSTTPPLPAPLHVHLEPDDGRAPNPLCEALSSSIFLTAIWAAELLITVFRSNATRGPA